MSYAIIIQCAEIVDKKGDEGVIMNWAYKAFSNKSFRGFLIEGTTEYNAGLFSNGLTRA